MANFISILSTLIGPTQLGGWVRAGIAAAGGFLVAHYGMQYWNGDAVISGIGTAASAIVVGFWSSLAKVTAVIPATPVAPAA